MIRKIQAKKIREMNQFHESNPKKICEINSFHEFFYHFLAHCDFLLHLFWNHIFVKITFMNNFLSFLDYYYYCLCEI